MHVRSCNGEHNSLLRDPH